MMETLMQVLLKRNDAVAVLEKLQYEVFLATFFLEIAEIYCKWFRFSLQVYQSKHLRLSEDND